ncbi:putative abc transporter b family member 8 [Quercus suber]|uniref:Abc transporter b family member 8 n=1 Tax=Quercus suber TaxID=58331 RepID=A0AAW0KTQ4_QUESU
MLQNGNKVLLELLGRPTCLCLDHRRHDSCFFAPSHEEMRARIRTYSLIFCSLTFGFNHNEPLAALQFCIYGERLTQRVRLRMLVKMLSFETAWFDDEQNSSGALCSRLSNEASMVKSLVADRLSLLLQTASAVTIAMIMGLVVAWKLALVMIAVQPLTILCFYTRKVLLSTMSTNCVKAQNQSTQIAVEAVYNHRIVTSFGSVEKVLQLFDQAQEAPRTEARKKAWLAGIGMGSAQCLTFMSWALDFWYGGTLVEKGEISAGDVFKTFFILVSTGKVIAEAGSMTSDLAKGATAVASVFKILDRQSLIPGSYNNDGGDNGGTKLEKISGRIEMKKVDFAYPSRPETLVLRQFCLEVKPGTSIGLVGKSGCGKSTVIGLIQRFYDVESGSVKVDGVDIRQLIFNGIGGTRHSLAKSQLYIQLDALENEVVEAARAANAHEFISSLKEGYETECGERGVQLSGGQKQRIAIARAIIRNPTILLLDEATSALDVQSEQVVQEALDRIMIGRSTIVIAHRLNTIKGLDSIAFVADGKVMEQDLCSTQEQAGSLGMALPDVKYFTEASVAATRIFDRINRIPLIDCENTKGLVLDKIRGELEFEHVKFTYPSRPDSIVLKDFSLKVEAGKTVALVGASGSGKSTAIALVQRFYDADDGFVRIDGVDIKSLQMKWIRGKMGLVSQEHALFGTSIKENILFGKLDATMDEVGERGALLSGGQKQRIAIARAIIKNPLILLLDEATSALDSESEALIQNALDQASMGRTTLVIAHKLSTVRNADLIAVVIGGCIIEIGSHNDLINRKNGHYAKLAKLQRQFSCDDQEQSSELRVSSVARSSAGRPSTARSSPAFFPKSPIITADSPAPGSHPRPTFFRLLSLNAPEWKQGLVGSLSAIAFGAVQPVYALTIGGMIAAFFAPSHEEMRARIRTYSLIFCSLTLVSIIMNLLQHYNFAYMGERLTKRVRLRMLVKMLSFETAWFDDEQNSSGALCSRLSNEASMVKSLVADRLSLLLQTASAVTIAMIMGLVVAWKLALVMIAVQPLTILCFYTRKVLLSTMSTNCVKAQNQSTQIAVEAVYNHRIVTSFGSVEKVLQLFDQAQEAPRTEARKKAWLAGIGMGSAQCLTFMSWALDFWYGGTLVEKGEISAGDVFKTFFILVSTGKVIAEAGSMTSDLAKGATAVASVFKILDRQSLIPGSYNNDGGDNGGTKLEKISGRIEMKKVDFAYPSRPETLVLRQFCLEVKPGTSIGLVGKSGCGKSTVIGLIQRFYDVESGSVKVDGVDIRQLDIQWYRRHTALVSQEPVIYSGSIRDNIVIGKLDALENEVVEAARAANAHEFISSLKEGYETECGERGVQLSGGQKQRIAIARAIIRNPTILLLDEATSALDVQSEQVVQEALDRIMIGRSTIVIAHRLNTIKGLDSIAFVADGKVMEQGTYAQLKSKRGAFFTLACLQT